MQEKKKKFYSSQSNKAKKKVEDIDYSKFLPMTREQMQARGWEELDILLISGDAYIDHPSFGTPLIGRYLEAQGYRVGIIAQPDPQKIEDFQIMGRPRLYAGISAGAIDSMLAHYTAFRKKRSDDAYTAGGKAGKRPNRAIISYANCLRRAFPKLPIVGGGIEASLRRISHYDFWTDSLRKSILPDAKLDLVVYGMGEKAMLEIAQRLEKKKEFQPAQEVLKNIRGTARIISVEEAKSHPDALLLPSHEEQLQNKKELLRASMLLEKQVHQAKEIAIQHFDTRAILLEIPAENLTTQELDDLYLLPFTRLPHPSYKEKIPATEMMQTSITSHRGCASACTFCTLAIHQSRHISSRSKKSIFNEITSLQKTIKFNGHISDIGGPTANMWNSKCTASHTNCKRSSCLFPKICKSFKSAQSEHVSMLQEAKKLSNVKSIRVASGIRFDLALQDKHALKAYTGEFTGGQLKVAPEHCSPHILDLMRKPDIYQFQEFLEAFYAQSQKAHKEQYVVPYLMSAFPGCTNSDMKELKKWLKKSNWKPQQVQCFIPTPASIATACYYAECDTDFNDIYVAKSDKERLQQHYTLIN